MPRAARKKSASGVYHVIVRGINKQPIFHDNQDRLCYLDALANAKEKAGFLLFAYCLMDNHVHLLLQEQDESVGDTMKRIGAAYVFCYNRKYERVGPLFQGRFHSESVEDDTYLLTVLRYIHQNPLKAGISQFCGGYQWSSYRVYEGSRKSKLVDTELPMGILGGRARLLTFINTTSENDHCLDLEDVEKASDSELLGLLSSLLEGASTPALADMRPDERASILRQLKAVNGTSARQIARLTGLSRWMVENA